MEKTYYLIEIENGDGAMTDCSTAGKVMVDAIAAIVRGRMKPPLLITVREVAPGVTPLSFKLHPIEVCAEYVRAIDK